MVESLRFLSPVDLVGIPGMVELDFLDYWLLVTTALVTSFNELGPGVGALVKTTVSSLTGFIAEVIGRPRGSIKETHREHSRATMGKSISCISGCRR